MGCKGQLKAALGVDALIRQDVCTMCENVDGILSDPTDCFVDRRGIREVDRNEMDSAIPCYIANRVDRVLALVTRFGFDDDDLWFNGNIEAISQAGFAKIAGLHPRAIVQCPIDWLTPLMQSAHDEAKRILALLTEWGISRFSISWEREDLRGLLAQLHEWNHEVNIYAVPDLEAFLEAVVLLPHSVTSDFNFPQWNRYGHGSGKSGRRLDNSIGADGTG